MITTNIEIKIGLELPVGCITTPADKLDGFCLIPEREKLIKEHRFLPYFDIGDCGFDIEKNFHHVRSTYSIPLLTTTSEVKRLISNLFEKEAMMIKELLLLPVVPYVNLTDMMRRKEECPLFVESSV